MKPDIDKHVPIVFLAMFWSGGSAMTIPEIIGAFDWIFRLLIFRTELEEALNFLLSADLVESVDGRFKIRDDAYTDFKTFLERRKKNKFDCVRQYFERLPEIGSLTNEVQITDEQYKAYVSEYHRMMRNALAKTRKSRK
jgi:hypothetical protein